MGTQTVHLSSVEELLKSASERTQLADFGPAQFRENLDQLVASLLRTGAFTEQGLRQTREELTTLLCHRLQIQDWLTRYPEITSEQVHSPVFTTGLPRSGTTLLHHLFDHDDRLRLLRTWETSQPCPPPGFAPETIPQRMEDTRRRIAQVWQATVAGFDAIHMIDVEGPDECTQLLSNDFNQVGFFNYLNVPDYYDWIVRQGNFVSSYEYHRTQLQLLQWRTPPRRWVLKYPNHLLALNAISRVHKDVRFVITHRDPVKTLASLCDLTFNFRSSRSEQVNKREIGRQMLSFVTAHVKSLLEFSAANREIIQDVDYYALLKSPLPVMSEIYAFMDMEFPETVSRNIYQWMLKNPQGKRGDHDYALKDFGIDPVEAEEAFARYRQRYNIPKEG
jgi:hypothetical protein